MPTPLEIEARKEARKARDRFWSGKQKCNHPQNVTFCAMDCGECRIDLLLTFAQAQVHKSVLEERRACVEMVEFWGECECGSAGTLHEIAEDMRSRGGKGG